MMMRALLTGFILTMLLSAGTVFAKPNVIPGKWKFQTEAKMEGMSGMNVPPETHTQCITDQDMVPLSKNASQECRISNVRTKGNTISYDIVCSGQGGQMQGSAEITYNGDHMNGTMHLTVTGADMKMTNTTTGRRLGPCDGQTAPSSPGASDGKNSGSSDKEKPSAVETAIAEDAKEVSQAGREEVKQAGIEEVKKGVRGMFEKLFE